MPVGSEEERPDKQAEVGSEKKYETPNNAHHKQAEDEKTVELGRARSTSVAGENPSEDLL